MLYRIYNYLPKLYISNYVFSLPGGEFRLLRKKLEFTLF